MLSSSLELFLFFFFPKKKKKVKKSAYLTMELYKDHLSYIMYQGVSPCKMLEAFLNAEAVKVLRP